MTAVAVRLAPVLQEVAGRLAGRPAGDARREPMQWAYALRDAVGLAHPDMLVSHWDPALESDALAAAIGDGDGDWVDRLIAAPALGETAPGRSALELVRTLAGLFPAGPPLAVTVTGPASTAAALAPALLGRDAAAGERIELADLCADALAGLLSAYAQAGADVILVIEQDGSFIAASEIADLHSPLVRALAHHRIDGIAIGPEGADLEAAGYGSQAVGWDGDGAPPAVALVAPELWGLEPERFVERWARLVDAAQGADALLITDGPLAAAMPLENLQASRARPHVTGPHPAV
jgi:hypothetical protein